MNYIYDVAVIGSGPSGAMAALDLAKSGIKTVIIEKEILPRYKICGGGLVFRGRKILNFDISKVIEKEFNRVEINIFKKNISIKTERNSPVISMVMRNSFDDMLVKEAVKYGAILHQDTEVKALKFSEETNTMITNRGNFEAKIVIAADGALSPVSKMAELKDDRILIPAIEYEIEVSDEDFQKLSKSVRFDIDAIPCGYGWCFPKKNHLSIGVCILKTKARVDLKKYCDIYIKSLGISNIKSKIAHGFVIPVSAREEFVKNNVFLVGDAAGFADPIVAEGISNAIISGKLVAESIIESKIYPDKAKEIYLSKIENTLLGELKISLKLAKFFYENPNIRNLFVKKFGQRFAESLTDIFMGEKNYPKDYKEKINAKLRMKIF